MEPNSYVDVFVEQAKAAGEKWVHLIEHCFGPVQVPEQSQNLLRPISAGEWMRRSQWHTTCEGGWLWDPPCDGLTLRLASGLYVKILRFTPKQRHVHYQVLGHKGYRWMKLRQFLMEATVAGHFKRAPSGELVWIEPKELAHAE